MTSPHEITMLLEAAGAGDSKAPERLLPLIYDQLRRLAQSQMQRESPGQTLQPTALVHEAYIKLVGGADVAWSGRAHFFAAAAIAMRRILVDRARARRSDKRGGDRKRVELHEGGAMDPELAGEPSTDLIALDECLEKLKALHPRRHEVVMLRYFAGLSIEDTAAALGVSPATVKTDWAVARVWLFRAMNTDPSGTAGGGEPA